MKLWSFFCNIFLILAASFLATTLFLTIYSNV